MSNVKKAFMACLAIIFIFALSSCTQSLGYITVLTVMPPKDYDAVLIINGVVRIKGTQSKTAWEVYYRFNYDEMRFVTDDWTNERIETAVLKVTAHGETYEVDLDTEFFDKGYDVVTLDIKNRNITKGTPLGRSVFLISFRVSLILGVAGTIFYAFRFRKKRSWIAFAAISLPGEIYVNILVTGAFANSSLGLLSVPLIVVFFGIPIFIIKTIAMCIAINESQNRIRTVFCSFAASFASFLSLIILTLFFPQ